MLAVALPGARCSRGRSAALFLRRPGSLPLLAVAALPFRIPVEAGRQLGQPARPALPRGRGGRAGLRVGPPAGDGGADEPARPGAAWSSRCSSRCSLYAVQAAYSSDFEQALKNVAFFYVPFALLLRLLAGIAWTARLAARCLAVASALAVAFAAIGFWEYATQDAAWNPKVIASNQFENYFRVNSLFFDPNIYGRFLALVMIGLAGRAAVADAARRRWRGGRLAVLWGGLCSRSRSRASRRCWSARRARRAALARRGPSLAAAVAVVAAWPRSRSRRRVEVDIGDERSLDEATSGRVELLGGRRADVPRPAAPGVRLGLVRRALPRARGRQRAAGGVRLAHDPRHDRGRAGVLGLSSTWLVLFGVRGCCSAAWRACATRPDAGAIARGVVAAAFTALVFHTLAYAAFLEDPITWTLIGIGIGLLRPTSPPSPPASSAPAHDAPGARDAPPEGASGPGHEAPGRRSTSSP